MNKTLVYFVIQRCTRKETFLYRRRTDILKRCSSCPRAGQPVTLCGFSFGSRVGTEVGIGDTRVVRLISIGTPVDKYEDYDFLSEVRKPILFIHGDHDEFGALENVRRLVDMIGKNTDAEL